MQVRLLTRNYKGLFISKGRFGCYFYIHLPRVTHRIYFDKSGVHHDSYSTEGFNRMIQVERALSNNKEPNTL